MKLVKNRSHSRYKSLSNLLQGKNLEDVFNQESIEQIKNIFDGNVSNCTAIDMFSYFDVVGRVEDFHQMLKEDYKQSLKNEFKPSKDQLLISKEELDKTAKLIGDDSVKDKFYLVGGICQYIKDKVGQLLELEDNFEINFQESIINEEIQTVLNDKLKKSF